MNTPENLQKNELDEKSDFLPKIPSIETLNQVFDIDQDSAYRLITITYLLSDSVLTNTPGSEKKIKTKPSLEAQKLFEQVYEKIDNPFKSISLDNYQLNNTPLAYTSIVKIAILKQDKHILNWALNNFKPNHNNSISTIINIKQLIELCGFAQNLWQKTDLNFCHYLNNLILPKITPEIFLNSPCFEKNIPAIQDATIQVFSACIPHAKSTLTNGNISLVEEWLRFSEKWRDTYCWLQYFDEINSQPSSPLYSITGENLQNSNLINYLKNDTLFEKIHQTIPLQDYNRIVKGKNFSLIPRKSLHEFLFQTYNYLKINVNDELMQNAMQYCTKELAPREYDSFLNNTTNSWGAICLEQSEEQKNFYKTNNLNEVEFNKTIQQKQIAINLLFDKLDIPAKIKDFEIPLELCLNKQNLWLGNYFAQKIIAIESNQDLIKSSLNSTKPTLGMYDYEKVNWSNFLAVYLPKNSNTAVDVRQMQLIFDLRKDSTEENHSYSYSDSFKKIYCNLTQAHIRYSTNESTFVKVQIQKALLEVFSFLEKNNLTQECQKIIERIDIQNFSTDVAHQLTSRGIKRFTYCGLAVIAGMWDLAEKLMDSGSDWRFAKKQIRDQIGLSHRDEALAFYERYELKHMLNEKQIKKQKTQPIVIEEKKSFRL